MKELKAKNARGVRSRSAFVESGEGRFGEASRICLTSNGVLHLTLTVLLQALPQQTTLQSPRPQQDRYQQGRQSLLRSIAPLLPVYF